MDEYNQGWDPEVKQYFKKILNSFGLGAIWLLVIATLGIFFRMAFVYGEWQWYNVFFYVLLAGSFLFMLRFFYRVWSKKK